MKIFRDLKRKNKGRTVKLCPKCQQPELIKTTYGTFTNTENYKCRNCGYTGAFYIEIDQSAMENGTIDVEALKNEFPDFVESDE